MMILDQLGFRRAQAFAFEHLISLHCASGDMRWAVAAITLRSLGAIWTSGQRHLSSLVRDAVARRERVRFQGRYC